MHIYLDMFYKSALHTVCLLFLLRGLRGTVLCLRHGRGIDFGLGRLVGDMSKGYSALSTKIRPT